MSNQNSMLQKIDIGINDADRQAIADGLAKLLADTYTLYLTTHNFHWNVTGPMFNTLHVMFMAQYTELWNAVDPIAERIRSLGHFAPGSYQQFSKPIPLHHYGQKAPVLLLWLALATLHKPPEYLYRVRNCDNNPYPQFPPQNLFVKTWN
jgi:hypothetical protein